MGQKIIFGERAITADGLNVERLERDIDDLISRGELPQLLSKSFMLATYILAEGKAGTGVDVDDVVGLVSSCTEGQLREIALQTQARNQN
jgi:hypothetical protein